MPAGLTEADTMFSVREKPWHGLGVVLDKPPASLDEALALAGLDWEVRQAVVHYELPDDLPVSSALRDRVSVAGRSMLVRIPDAATRERGREIVIDPDTGLRNVRVNVRSDTGEPLGVVSTSYRVFQNRDAFAFLSNLIGSEMHFETAGSLLGGRRVWALVKKPEWIEVGGDPVEIYLCVQTRHDGQGKIRALVTPIRVVCQNTLHAALKGARQQFAVSHAGEPLKALAEARSALGITIQYAKQFKSVGDELASERVTDREMQRVLRELYPTDDAMSERAVRNRTAARDAIASIHHGDGPTVGNAPGSKWALYNAVCEYVDFYGGQSKRAADAGERPERTFTRAIDDPDGLKAQAFALLTN